jgi:hypothetical protein
MHYTHSITFWIYLTQCVGQHDAKLARSCSALELHSLNQTCEILEFANHSVACVRYFEGLGCIHKLDPPFTPVQACTNCVSANMDKLLANGCTEKLVNGFLSDACSLVEVVAV